jgi:PAS domain S-box-containing protein
MMTKGNVAGVEGDQGLFDRVPIGLYRTTPAGRFLDANPAMVETLGYPDRESLLAINAADLYVDATQRQQWQALLEGEQLVRGFRAQMRRYDGTIIWAREMTQVICDAQGRVLYYEGSLEDITERKQSDDRLRFLSSAVEQSSEGITVTDLGGRLLFVNNAFALMHGYTPVELAGRHLSILHTPAQMPAVDAANRQLREEGEFTGEIWHVRRDGTEFPALMHSSLLRNEAGEAIGMIGTARDITDRKRAQEALTQSEAQYRALVEGSLQGIVIAQAWPLRLIFANPMACEMLGFTTEELTALEPHEIEAIMHPADRPDLLQRVAGLLEGEPPLAPLPIRVFRKDGTMRWLEAFGWETEYGGCRAFQVSMMDVTERMEAEKALRESELRYRTLFEASRDAIFLETLEGRILDCNTTACEMFGYDKEALVGLTVADLTPAEAAEALPDVIDQELETGGIFLEAVNKRQDGQLFPVAVSTRLATIGQEQLVVAYVRDITERKQTEALLHAQRDLALALEQATGLDATLRLCLDIALDVSGMDSGGIYLMDTASGALDLACARGLSDEFIQSVSHLDADTINMRLVRTGQAVYGRHGELIIQMDDARRRENLRALAVIPIHHEGRAMACLNLASHTLDEVPLFARHALETVASQIGSAIARAAAKEALARRATQLELLKDVGSRIAVVLELDSLPDRAVDLVHQSFGYHHVALFVLDRGRGELAMRTLAGAFSDRFPPNHRLALGQGLVGWAARYGQTVLANDVEAEPRYVNLYPGLIPTRAELSVPICLGDKILGVLDIQSPRRNAFDENDVMVMETLADQIAVAMNNAQLYQQVRRELAERARTEEALRESEERYRRLFEDSPICLWEEDFSAAKTYLDHLRSQGIEDFRSHFEDHPEVMVQCADRVKVLNVNKAAVELYQVEDRDALCGPLAAILPPEAYEGFREELIAVVAGKTWFEGDVVTEPLAGEEKHTLTRWTVASGHHETLSRVLVSVIDITDRVRAEEEIQRRTAQLEALRVVGLELAAKLNLEDLLYSIVSHATKLMGETSGGLYLHRPELDVLEWAVSVGTSEVPIGSRLQRGEGLSGKVWQTGKPLIVHDYQQWEGRAAIFGEFEWAAVVGAPVRWGDEFLGVVTVEGRARGAFQPADAELLSLFATQAAIAITNARLFEAERAAREQAETLQAATQALSATLDLQQVFELILSELRRVVPYDSASVQELRGGRLEIIGGYGFPNLEELLGESFDLSADDNPNREVVRSRGPFILDDAPTVYKAFHREPHDRAGIRSWLGVPLLFGDRLIGMISLDKQEPGFYSDEHASLALAFAAQAAIAIENARLFKAEREQRELAEALRQAASAMSSTLDLDQILDQILEQVDRVIPNDAVNVNLMEGDQARIVRWRGYERFGPDIQSVVLPVTSTPSLRRMKETGEVIVISDLADYEDWVDVSEVDWIKSYAAAPIRVREQVIGFLNVDSATPGFFNQTHADRLRAFADQVSLAIENARLYEETRRQNRELALLNRVIAASATGQKIERILETVCRELALAYGLPQATAVLFNKEKTGTAVMAEYRAGGERTVGEIGSVGDDPADHFLNRHQVPLVVDNAQTDPRLASSHDLMRQRGIVSLLMLPLIVEGETVGRLELAAPSLRPFSPQEVDLAQRVADHVSGAMTHAQLAEAQRRLIIAVEQAAEAVVITDVQGTILYVNPAFERITGYSHVQAIGFGPRSPKGSKDHAAFYLDMWRMATSSPPWHGRFTDRKPDGSLYTVDSTLTPVRNQAGEMINYVATLRDVTREVQLEEQFRQAQKMEALGRLAGGIAHDFNNLLTVVHMSAALIKRQLRPEDPLWEHVQRIQDTGKRAANLTRQLLSFSRREVAEPKILNLSELVGDLSQMLQRIVGEDIELVTALRDDLSAVKVDPTQMDQVIMNLVVNARDAMPQGGSLTIETANTILDETYAATHVDVQPGRYVMLAITDTGVGMDSEVQSHLFEPFFTTKEPGQGTGLGLATVFGIVKQSRGHIRVYSEVGLGTTFKIYLPCIVKGEARHKAAPDAFQRGSTRLAIGTQTILVVEDEADVLNLAVGVLQSCGYRVLAAGDGLEAVCISEQHDGPIHLLLTDAVMPQISGQELAKQLQRRRPEMRVLYMSGYADNAIVQHGLLALGAAFLPKPFTVEQLTQKVWAVLNEKSPLPGTTP